MYFTFFVFVCLCAAVYGVIKNNNLVRLSSVVPFQIIYQVNLYWRNNSAHKYNYFETLLHTLAFHTNFSRIFHPCNLVPHFHVSHFQSPHLWPGRRAAAVGERGSWRGRWRTASTSRDKRRCPSVATATTRFQLRHRRSASAAWSNPPQRYDTIRDAILTCARKPTRVSLIYRTEPTTKKCFKKHEKN